MSLDKDDVAEEIELAIAILAEHANLTPDHQRFIDAMIRGVWECETCNAREEGGVYCLVHSIHMVHPCYEWQERKEGEDG